MGASSSLGGWTRTSGLRLPTPAVYQLTYTQMKDEAEHRTGDLHIGIVALYQLS